MEPIPNKVNFVDFLDAPTEFNPWVTDVQAWITSSGQTVGGNNVQFARSASIYAGQSTYYIDSGTVNNFVLTSPGTIEPAPVNVLGLEVRFLASTTNTGACTIDRAGTGAIALKTPEGNDIPPNTISKNEYVRAVFNGTFFILEATSESGGSSDLTGAIAWFAVDYTTAIEGWLYCSGIAISRAGNADLYAKIGTSYGAGNGTTTFNIPDFRGRFIRCTDGGAGRDTDRGGVAFAMPQNDQFKAHKHSLSRGNVADGPLVDRARGSASAVSTGTTGGSETRPTNLVASAYIKL